MEWPTSRVITSCIYYPCNLQIDRITSPLEINQAYNYEESRGESVFTSIITKIFEMIFEQKYSRIIFVIECHWGGVSNKRRGVNFYFNDIFIGDNNNEMDRFTAIKKKKGYKSQYLFRDSNLDLDVQPWLNEGTVKRMRGVWRGGESYGALMRILPKDRSPAIMIHEFNVQRIADAPCYVIVSQLTTRIP